LSLFGCRFHPALARTSSLEVIAVFLASAPAFPVPSAPQHLFTCRDQFNNSSTHYFTVPQTSTYTSSRWARTTSFPRVSASSYQFPPAPSSRLPRRFLERIGIVKLGIVDPRVHIDGHTFHKGTASSCQTSPSHPYTIGIIGASAIYSTSSSRWAGI
jgi:hypothetical protein